MFVFREIFIFKSVGTQIVHQEAKMSRSGYSENCEGWDLIRWRGAVASAIRGGRGQEFLHKLIAALDALPNKRLIDHELEKDGEVCALGSLGRMQSIEMSKLDPYDHEGLAQTFNIAPALVQEVEFINDDGWQVTPEERFAMVRKWAVTHLDSAEHR
jgi:hypothetical protein